jgi:alpha-beta hydrolase superfamily lysophospholipase
MIITAAVAGSTYLIDRLHFVHGFAETKSTASIVTLAEDFASAGYVSVMPTVRGFGNSDGSVCWSDPTRSTT